MSFAPHLGLGGNIWVYNEKAPPMTVELLIAKGVVGRGVGCGRDWSEVLIAQVAHGGVYIAR